MQEFRVDSGNQNAEYRAVATVTMLLKQGENAFHGLAYEYLQNKVLNANQFLLNASGQNRPDAKFNQFGRLLQRTDHEEQIVLFWCISWNPGHLFQYCPTHVAIDGNAKRRFLRVVHYIFRRASAPRHPTL